MTTKRPSAADPVVKTGKITDFIPDSRNANLGTERGLDMIETSYRKSGAGRSILADKNNRLIAGNKSQEAAINAGITDAIIVETDGTKVVVVKRTDLDLDTPEGRRLALADNRTSQIDYVLDAYQLKEFVNEGVDVSGLWTDKELYYELPPDPDPGDSLDGDQNPALTIEDVPDALWPTDNDYGIPLLDIQMQADALDAPVLTWGSIARVTKHKGGTYHFYTDDYRFNDLWRDPTKLVNSGIPTIIEPNFSAFGNMPFYEAVNRIGRKRWLARYWQSKGIRVIVDLNVPPVWDNISLLGVPRGWQWYATRGYNQELDSTIEQYERCKIHAEGKTVTFIVYGGGKVMERTSRKYGWLWIPEQQAIGTAKRGK